MGNVGYIIVHPIPLCGREDNILSKPKDIFFRGSCSFDEVGHWTTMPSEALTFKTKELARKIADNLFPQSKGGKVRRIRFHNPPDDPEQIPLPIRESEK